MAEYKTLKGFEIQVLESDPANPIAGQVFYNSTTQILKGVRGGVAADGTWASGGNLNQARTVISGLGTQTAALTAGGFNATVPGVVVSTEAYNGSAWTEVNNLNTARNTYNSGSGSQTAGLQVNGNAQGVESWDGTNWTEIAETNTLRNFAASAGLTNTANMFFGGTTPAPANVATNELWNGTSWTEVNDMNSARNELGGFGNPAAALAVGGSNAAGTADFALTESWNGTSWTEVNDLNLARQAIGAAGTQTSGIAFAGMSPFKTETESWNGTSWSEVAEYSTATKRLGSSGASNQSALGFGGTTAGANEVVTTEEWTVPSAVVLTFDVS